VSFATETGVMWEKRRYSAINRTFDESEETADFDP
jgi:hypothetical protein